jgi:hypothetical protein
MCYSASNLKCKELNDLDFMFGWICAKIINFEHFKITINWLNVDIHTVLLSTRTESFISFYNIRYMFQSCRPYSDVKILEFKNENKMHVYILNL